VHPQRAYLAGEFVVMSKLGRATNAQVAALFEMFQGRPDVHGRQSARTEEVWTAKSPLTLELYHGHLAGTGDRVGAHYLQPDGTTRVVVVDIDQEVPGLAQRIVAALRSVGIAAHLERSKSKGYHVWIFFTAPVLGRRAQQLRAYLRERFIWVGEYFPRQDALEPDGIGNFMFLPHYGRAAATRTVFLDPPTLTVIPDQVTYLLQADRATPVALDALVANVRLDDSRSSRAALPANWLLDICRTKITEGERHPTFVSLAGRLLARQVPAEDVVAILLLVNRAACDPPKPEPGVVEEIRELVGWVQKRETSRRSRFPWATATSMERS
jgi:hypothetical protein